MPPRTRTSKTTDPTEATAPDAAGTTESIKATKAPKVKGSDAVLLTAVSVATGPAPKKKMTRDNPFDDYVALSYKENDEAADVWRQFDTTEEGVKPNAALLRSAATYLGIGVSIRPDTVKEDGTVTVYFRGKDKTPRKTKDAE